MYVCRYSRQAWHAIGLELAADEYLLVSWQVVAVRGHVGRRLGDQALARQYPLDGVLERGLEHVKLQLGELSAVVVLGRVAKQ